jgi:hypothetical protein
MPTGMVTRPKEMCAVSNFRPMACLAQWNSSGHLTIESYRVQRDWIWDLLAKTTALSNEECEAIL